MALLHIITLVIQNFRPFRSISYRFRDKNFFSKSFQNMALLHIMIAPSRSVSKKYLNKYI